MPGRGSARSGDKVRARGAESDRRPGDVTLCNLTARRIGIAARAEGGVDLVIPPFGERTLSGEELARYEYDEWTAHRLVSVDCVGAQTEPEEGKRGAAGRIMGGAIALATVAFVVLWVVRGQTIWALLALGSTVLTLAIASELGSRDVRDRIMQSWGIVGVTVIAVGLPLWANVYYWPRFEAGEELVLGLFVSAAAGLPGALYFLFQRQKLPTLRESFVRDLVRLDPNVQTTQDAENAYGPLIEEAYGSEASGLAGGRSPIFLSTLLLAGFWIWLLGDANASSPLTPRAEVVAFAFLGSYVFAVNTVFRRYTRADLNSKAYTHIMVRTLVAVVSAWAVTYLPWLDDRAESVLFLLAFLIGVVPETGVAIVQDFLRKQKALGSIPSVRELHPLSKLDGISLYDSAQLLEAGIENVESLAHHRMVDLMLWTRIPTSRLVDLVDQAILYLHVRGPMNIVAAEARTDGSGADGQSRGSPRDVDDPEDGARIYLCRHGIRTATDLERAVNRAAARSKRERERVLAMLGTPSGVSRLSVVLDAMEDDEWLAYVRNWRETTSAGPVVRSVREFADLAVRESGLPATREPWAAAPAAEKPVNRRRRLAVAGIDG